MVVFSVLLALLANDWREAVQHRQEARRAERSILSELDSNRAAVAAARQYHSLLLEQLHQARDQGRAPAIQSFPRGFIAPARPQRIAWESAAQTGALSHLPYPRLLELARAYAQQQRYEEQARAVSELLYAALFAQGTAGVLEHVEGLSTIVSTFRFREDELLEAYDRLLHAVEPP